tara:strand:+ start:2953 stop:4923 length:1971 start_codon:yes stop_codon:yes gene_type:complete
MKIILQIFLAIVPLFFSFSTLDPTLSVRFLALSILILTLLIHQFYVRKQIVLEIIKQPFIIFFSIILFSYFLSSCVNGFSAEGIYVLLKFFLAILFCFLITHFLVKYNYKDFLNSFVIFSLLVSLIYFYQYISNYSDIISLEKDWQRNAQFDKISSTMGHKNLLSSINFLLLPFLFYSFISQKKVWRFFSLLSIVLIFLVFIQTQTRAVFAATFISLISYILIRKNFGFKNNILIFSSFIFMLCIGYFLMVKTDRIEAFKSEIKKTFEFSTTSRYKLYSSTVKLISENPFFGVGPGNWKISVWEFGLYFDSFGKSFAQRPHNDFLWVFAEGGFIAGISYILLFLILLRDSYNIYKKKSREEAIFFGLIFSVILGYGFISLVDFPIERFSHLIVFLFTFSIVIAEKIKDKKLNFIQFPKWIFFILFSLLCFSTYVGFIRYNGEVHTARAIKYKNKGNWSRVVKEIDKGYNENFFKIDNTSTPLLWYKGVAYFNLSKLNFALKDFQSSYSVNPFHVHVLNNLATLHELNNNSGKAKKYYNEVFNVCPTFKETRVNLAAILFNERKYTEALDVILESKVEPYWKRKPKKDNYDQYLKTIYNGFFKNISFPLTQQEKKSLNRLKIQFEKWPNLAEERIRSAYKIRISNNINYVKAITKVK